MDFLQILKERAGDAFETAKGSAGGGMQKFPTPPGTMQTWPGGMGGGEVRGTDPYGRTPREVARGGGDIFPWLEPEWPKSEAPGPDPGYDPFGRGGGGPAPDGPGRRNEDVDLLDGTTGWDPSLLNPDYFQFF